MFSKKILHAQTLGKMDGEVFLDLEIALFLRGNIRKPSAIYFRI